MSELGKLTRGMKFYFMRDIEGNLPDGIKDSEEKMEDVEYYLDFIKNKKKKKVDEVLITLRNFTRGGINEDKKKYKDIKKLLYSEEIKEKVEKPAKNKNSEEVV